MDPIMTMNYVVYIVYVCTFRLVLQQPQGSPQQLIFFTLRCSSGHCSLLTSTNSRREFGRRWGMRCMMGGEEIVSVFCW